MNMVLFMVVIVLWSFFGWEQRRKGLRINVPYIKVKKLQNKQREFQTFRYIDTHYGIRCIEEQRYRII